MILVSPPEDSADVLDLVDATPEQLRLLEKALKWLASKHGWPFKVAGGKLFTGPRAKVVAAATPKPAKVPVYYSQRDSQVWKDGRNQAGRMCFSSSCAMLLKDLKPGALSDSPNADDDYLRRVFDRGDTTIAENQLAALAHFGLKATFTTTMSLKELDRLLQEGKKVVTGLLHHGHRSAPTGGGHYMFVYGKEGDAYRLHDPYGEMDLVNGGYLHADGKSRLYSVKNFAARWCVENPRSGYALYVP